MLEVLSQDYVRVARAKGLGRPVIILRHTLRNALLPVVTIIGINVANLREPDNAFHRCNYGFPAYHNYPDCGGDSRSRYTQYHAADRSVKLAGAVPSDALPDRPGSGGSFRGSQQPFF